MALFHLIWPAPKAPARLRNFALCWKKHSLASTGFLEHLKTLTDGLLSTKCLAPDWRLELAGSVWGIGFVSESKCYSILSVRLCRPGWDDMFNDQDQWLRLCQLKIYIISFDLAHFKSQPVLHWFLGAQCFRTGHSKLKKNPNFPRFFFNFFIISTLWSERTMQKNWILSFFT